MTSIARKTRTAQVRDLIGAVITATSVGQGRFAAQIGDHILVEASRQPLLDAARVLLSQGADPRTVIALRHAGSTTDALRSTVGAAAKLTVEETSHGPAFRSFRTAPASAVDRPPIEQPGRAGHCAP
jgi:hypothetical protein